MNGLRRNDAKLKTNAGNQKNPALKPELNIANWFETRGAFYRLHDHCN